VSAVQVVGSLKPSRDPSRDPDDLNLGISTGPFDRKRFFQSPANFNCADPSSHGRQTPRAPRELDPHTPSPCPRTPPPPRSPPAPRWRASASPPSPSGAPSTARLALLFFSRDLCTFSALFGAKTRANVAAGSRRARDAREPRRAPGRDTSHLALCAPLRARIGAEGPSSDRAAAARSRPTRADDPIIPRKPRSFSRAAFREPSRFSRAHVCETFFPRARIESLRSP
jgi:hypothetical protein